MVFDRFYSINAIRARAGLSLYVFVSLSPADFADKVVQECAWEFVTENTRFFDLVVNFFLEFYYGVAK